MSTVQDLRADVAGLITARFTRPGPYSQTLADEVLALVLPRVTARALREAADDPALAAYVRNSQAGNARQYLHRRADRIEGVGP